MHITRNTQQGFSLIELMVALTIFSIVMTVAIGTLLVLIDANGKAQAVSSATTNLSFAIDSMTRNLRTGRDYYCTSASNLNGSTLPSTRADCASGNTAVVFTPGFESTWRMGYRLNGSTIEQRIDRGSTNGPWVPITSDQPPAQVNVDTLRFIVQGSADNITSGDENQPRIVLLIAGSVENGLSEPTNFEIQSNVVQRVLNY